MAVEPPKPGPAPRPELWKPLALQSWGRMAAAPCLAARPERLRELQAALAAPGGRALLPRGAGRSYGDACLNPGGAVVLTERLNRLLAFDPASGLLLAEPGVTFADLLRIFLPRGFLAPASPGTAFVTLGGAVAHDVHGKNQHLAGSIGEHIAWFDLLLADGSTSRVTPESDPALFRATIGGLGLTGILTAICLRLEPVPSNALLVRRQRVPDLDAFLAGFEANAAAPYAVGWIDALAQGAELGRGVLEVAGPSPEGLPDRPAKPRRLPFDLPGFALNRLSIAAFNELYWRRAPALAGEERVAYERFLYPLDAILDWNRLYGRGGFHQFQCVLPFREGEPALRRLLETIAAGGNASFLAVLKAMGREGVGMLSFARPGYSLALDIPARPGSAALFAALERITVEAGGRVYLAKDAWLSPQGFAAMYPEAPEFQAVRARVDPDGAFSSGLSRRLGLG
ncbi:FAD-binding oxidoreductase [Siccirubricoccus phaeus]|uniref:FAD-binding oxidoreductase n=1 Tax=Siccirubricoccus phaeus TaxID=2595053 RepID=UPI001A9C9563|nr:FAD-binding oxidoreductase [Siccirubricoccus phaeus]